MIRLVLPILIIALVTGLWLDENTTTTEATTPTTVPTTVPTSAPTSSYTCEKPGFQCSPNCESVLFCDSSSGDAFIVDDCTSQDKLCTQDAENNYICSDNVTTCHLDELPVKCTGVGPYPSAYNCSVSYFCLEANQPPKYACDCPENSFYELGTCSKDPIGYQSCCENSTALPKCSKVGDMGNFGPNCHVGFYYICGRDENNKLVANVFRCEPGQVFIDGSCTESKHNIITKGLYPKVNAECKEYGSSF